ncbi:AMP-binding protein [Luminiphilus sp. nBUS_16]|uniref:AMP-binding protein n=1 Tax=Luminiphilus sp. nBUS_16 TaxID=3395315 RepID=UPI003EB8A202|tara:strand:- start:100 stop:1758 length:1659 start_codon:yes stop_codon:yes gene_type:complete
MESPTLIGQLAHWAEECPDRVWLRDLNEAGETSYSWSEAQDQVHAVAAALEKRLGSGHSMALLSKNRAHWVLADLAVIASGNVSVPLFTTHTAATAQYILEFTDTKVLFLGETTNWDAVKEVMPEGGLVITLPGVSCDEAHVTWDTLLQEGQGQRPSHQSEASDLISLVFTSGTTGMPKGVIQTHESNLIPVRRGTEAFASREGSRFFSYLPLSHIAERQIVEYGSMVACGEIWFNESLDTLLRDLPACKPNIFFGPPRVWEQLQQAVLGKVGGQEALDQLLEQDAEGMGALVLGGLGLTEVDYCLTAAAPTPPALIHWWDKLGLPLCEGFGQTEAMSLIVTKVDDRRIGSIGKPISGVEVKISDIGELLIRAEGCTPGYYQQPEKTAELWQNGWLHTGDKAYIDDDGFIFITGRVKDYFKTIQGKFVAPPPIEGLFADNVHAEQQCLLGRGFSKTVMVTVLSDAAGGVDRGVVEASVLDTITSINSEIEKHARIGAVIISNEHWTIENEILTPTLKIRRERVETVFAEKAEQLARQSAEQGEVLVHWFDNL